MEEANVEEIRRKAKEAMEKYIRPREEVTMIRKLMAFQLSQNFGTNQLRSPLSLIDTNTEVSESKELQGLQREYVEAVRMNIKVRMEFTKAQEDLKAMAASLKPTKDPNTSLLDLHLEITKLQQRHEKQKVVLKYLDQLEQQPAAAPDFLDPKVMFKDCRPLPEVPTEMVNGFAVDHDATDAEVQELLQRLQKTALRSKLLYRREKQRIEQAQARDQVHPKNLSPEAKLQALNAVKNTLINWIESQLGKAGDDEAEDDEASEQSRTKSHVDHEAQLAQIQKEYERHIELRKEILALLDQKDHIPSIKSAEATDNKTSSAEEPVGNPAPMAYILTPYLEKLNALSREQKSLIQEKSHINSTLAKQQEDSKLVLDHLAQESQLLLQYPVTKSGKQKLSFGEATMANKLNVVQQVQPWIYAADSAKIATLETVAEKVEEGMMSIDESRRALEEICKLLDVQMSEGKPEGDQVPETDLWLPEGDDQDAANVTKTGSEKEDEARPTNTIWTRLDGNLGFINE